VLNDIGGIYTLGVSPGTVLHHNLIHDVTRFERGNEGYGGWGIYPDAGSSELRIENNVVYDTRDGSLHVHNHGQPYGNVVTNNIFAYSTDGVLMRNADHDPEGNHVHLERNIVYNAGPEMFSGNNWKKDSKFTSDKNCFWSEAGTPDFYRSDVCRMAGNGPGPELDHCRPRLRDAANRDFRLEPDSPAFALGFTPIDMSTVGLQGPEEWTGLPDRSSNVARTNRPCLPTSGRWRTISRTTTSTRSPPVLCPTKAAPASESRTTGRHRAVNQCDSTTPPTSPVGSHTGVPTWTSPGDILRFSCSLFNDPSQTCSIHLEFRDWPKGETYQTGPYLQFLPDGTVRVPDGGLETGRHLPARPVDPYRNRTRSK
jgi:hypothetical protein